MGSSRSSERFSESQTDEPYDKYKLVYITLFIAGLGTLLPWNFFITAIPYFQYKLRNTSLENASYLDPLYMTKEQVLFGNYLALCSMLPLALTNMAGLLVMRWLSSFTRYTIGSILVFSMFLLTVILVKIDIDSGAFLGITLTSVVIINAGSALVQGGVLGIASILPPLNMKACLEGQAIAGVLAAVAQLVTLGASPHPTTSALAYFIFALAVLTSSVLLTLTLRKNAYFVHFQQVQNLSKEIDVKENPSSYAEATSRNHLNNPREETEVELRSGFRILRSLHEVWLPGLCVLCTLMFTLALFPALLHSVRSLYYSPTDRWTSTFFTPVVVFLSFNVFDWVGRSLAGLVKWPRRHQRWLLLAICVSRVLLIPFAMFLNQQPRYHLPVVFHHDAFLIIFIIVLALSNGYLMTLAMMYGPSFASPGNSEGAGVALSIYIALGLAFGVAVSAGLALLI